MLLLYLLCAYFLCAWSDDLDLLAVRAVTARKQTIKRKKIHKTSEEVSGFFAYPEYAILN